MNAACPAEILSHSVSILHLKSLPDIQDQTDSTKYLFVLEEHPICPVAMHSLPNLFLTLREGGGDVHRLTHESLPILGRA